MPNIQLYGRQTRFVGKTLFQILANLKNFGVGRIVLKQEELLDNPGRKCYYIIRKVEPVMVDDNLERGVAWAERIYCGARMPDLVYIDENTWHSDWQLVPKDQENNHVVPPEELVEMGHPSTVRVMPRWMEVPPLMNIFLRRHREQRGAFIAPVKVPDNASAPVQIRASFVEPWYGLPHKPTRVAEENEEINPKFINLKDLLDPKFSNAGKSHE